MIRLIKVNIYLWRNRVYVEYIGWSDGNSDIQLFRSINGGIIMTIEERADAYVGHSFEIDEFSSASTKRQAFIDGAKEQRKIDIEKACEWLSDYFVFKHEAMSAQGCDAFLKKFRSAMEE